MTDWQVDVIIVTAIMAPWIIGVIAYDIWNRYGEEK